MTDTPPTSYAGYMPVTDQCMAFPVKDGPRCTRRTAYELTIRFDDGRVVDKIMWCSVCTGGLKAKHPEQIVHLWLIPRV